jgi:hypothetical protein
MICVGMLGMLGMLMLLLLDGLILLLLFQRKDRFDMVTVSASPIDPSSLPVLLVLGAPLVVVVIIGPAMVSHAQLMMINVFIFHSCFRRGSRPARSGWDTSM